MGEEEISRTLALAWGLAAAPQRGPKRELSLERIVEAAIEIADAEGLAAVTMQRVAQTFDFSTMALYRYVANKDDLHQLMRDTAMSNGLAPPMATDWREGFGALLKGLIAGYRAHPWALDIPLTPDIHLMPGQVRIADLSLRTMRDLQAPSETKLAMLMLLSAFAMGHAAVEREVLAGVEAGPQARALIEEAVTMVKFPDVAPLVRNGIYFGADAPNSSPAAEPTGGEGAEASVASTATAEAEADAILEFATEVLLAGLDSMLASMPEQAATTAGRPQPTPQQAYEAAEAAYLAHKDLRKRTQQRVRELEREESVLQKSRDRAKELARAHARLEQAP